MDLKKKKKMNEKNRVLESAKKLSDARDEIIFPFEEGIIPCKDNSFKTKEKESEEEESEKERYQKFIE